MRTAQITSLAVLAVLAVLAACGPEVPPRPITGDFARGPDGGEAEGGAAADLAMGVLPDGATPPDLAVRDAASDAALDAAPPDVAMPADLTVVNAVEIQLLSISDWHGQVDPLTVNGQEVGGAAILSAYFQKERKQNPNTLTVTAGDAFGASPPLAAFFDEAPAVKALNLMGLQVDTFGNHNFDRSLAHLQQMIDLASYKYVSSNLDNLGANLQKVASPYHLVDLGGVKVGVLGITNDDAPSLVFPGKLGNLAVRPSAMAATQAAQAARTAGAKLVVALVHLGASGADMNGKPFGPLIDFANAVTGIDVILGDHTDFVVNTVVKGAIVVENRSKGVTYARVKLTVDPASGKIGRARST